MAGFDPRKHSTVVLAIKEKQPLYYGTNSGKDAPLKSYMIGPNKPDPSGVDSLRRPITAPSGPLRSSKTPKSKNEEAHPVFLAPDGKWNQGQMPVVVAESQAQALCATGTITSTLPGPYGANRPIRPLTSVYTYNDVSPAVSAQHVQDGEPNDPVATIRHPPLTGSTGSLGSSAKEEPSSYTANLKKTIGNPQARINSINTFWNRLNGAYNLEIKDVDRIEELGKNTVAGTPNCRLIGSRWRYLARPVDGDVIYTDYYGRCGDDPCAYYGRRYEMQTKGFNQNGIVEDTDYIRVGASMTGIQSLRTRPGLSMDATVVSGPSARLEKISPYAIKQTHGVHKLGGFARLKPSH